MTRTIATGSVLTLALGVLVALVAAEGTADERPYEESVYLAAAAGRAPAVPAAGEEWCEHPPLGYALLRTAATLAGPDAVTLRSLWAAAYLAAFALGLVFVWASAPADRGAARGWGTLAGRGTLVLAAFVSPLALTRSAQVGPEAPAVLLVAVALLVARRLLDRPTLGAAVGLGLALAGVAAAHAYGPLVAAGLLVGCALAGVCAPNRLPLRLWAVVVAVACLPIVLDPSGFRGRLALLTDHYWAGETGWLPLAGMWATATEMTQEFPAATEAAHLIGLLVLVGIAVRTTDAATRAAAVAALACAVGLWGWARATDAYVIVNHWLAPVWILAWLAAARGLSGRALAVAAVVGAAVVLLPGVLSAANADGRGRSQVSDAAAEVRRLADGADLVVFGGSRAYLMFQAELGPDFPPNSWAFIRTRVKPDNFPGRRLIPADRQMTETEWERTPARRVVVVHIAAAQRVEVPTAGWSAVSNRRFAHQAFSIEDISVELIERPGRSSAAPTPEGNR